MMMRLVKTRIDYTLSSIDNIDMVDGDEDDNIEH